MFLHATSYCWLFLATNLFFSFFPNAYMWLLYHTVMHSSIIYTLLKRRQTMIYDFASLLNICKCLYSKMLWIRVKKSIYWHILHNRKQKNNVSWHSFVLNMILKASIIKTKKFLVFFGSRFFLQKKTCFF